MKHFYALLLAAALCSGTFAQYQEIPVEPFEERLNKQHKPMQLMDVIGLEDGMVIADIGAGRGRMTVFFASRVGEKGMVLANDIDQSSLEYLARRCDRNNIRNVKTFVGTVTDPMLPKDTADIAFLVSTYHHLDKPVEMMRYTRACLKPDGRLIIVERDPAKTGQTSSESTSQDQLIGEVTGAGYELLKIDTQFLESDNIYFFKVKSSL